MVNPVKGKYGGLTLLHGAYRYRTLQKDFTVREDSRLADD